jgi:hypothetical protein
MLGAVYSIVILLLYSQYSLPNDRIVVRVPLLGVPLLGDGALVNQVSAIFLFSLMSAARSLRGISAMSSILNSVSLVVLDVTDAQPQRRISPPPSAPDDREGRPRDPEQQQHDAEKAIA